MSDYVLYGNYLERMFQPFKYEPPQCKIREWLGSNKRSIICFTGGEKWMCKGYKTETPGQLSKADKALRDNWKTIE